MALLAKQRLPVPPINTDPRVTIQNTENYHLSPKS